MPTVTIGGGQQHVLTLATPPLSPKDEPQPRVGGGSPSHHLAALVVGGPGGGWANSVSAQSSPARPAQVGHGGGGGGGGGAGVWGSAAAAAAAIPHTPLPAPATTAHASVHHLESSPALSSTAAGMVLLSNPSASPSVGVTGPFAPSPAGLAPVGPNSLWPNQLIRFGGRLCGGAELVLPAAAAGGGSGTAYSDAPVVGSSRALTAQRGEGLNYAVMVYNVSHSDLLLSALGKPKDITVAPATGGSAPGTPPGSDVTDTHSTTSSSSSGSGASAAAAAAAQSSNAAAAPQFLIARPKFHMFKAVGDALSQELERIAERKANGGADLTPAYCPLRDGYQHPFGYWFPQTINFQDWSYFHVRSETRDMATAMPRVNGMFFPLLSVMLPRWNLICSQRMPVGTKRVLYLISGAGTPWNQQQDSSGNSTHSLAKLLKAYCAQFYPYIHVQILHSGAEIFHYDANVLFVHQKLRPPIEQHRRELAHVYADKWSQHLHITLSLSEGAPARISAINAALRQFRPDCLHMWQLKTFWHSFPHVTAAIDDDLEFHEFETLEMTPAIPMAHVYDQAIRAVVNELIEHKRAFEKVRDTQGLYHELGSFWLRKSRQPVLSVLMVQKSDPVTGQPLPWILYRGINMEVSMPTGSLCSERNAIGTALNHDPGLTRRDIKIIAVLALPLDTKDAANSAGGAGGSGSGTGSGSGSGSSSGSAVAASRAHAQPSGSPNSATATLLNGAGHGSAAGAGGSGAHPPPHPPFQHSSSMLSLHGTSGTAAASGHIVSANPRASLPGALSLPVHPPVQPPPPVPNGIPNPFRQLFTNTAALLPGHAVQLGGNASVPSTPLANSRATSAPVLLQQSSSSSSNGSGAETGGAAAAAAPPAALSSPPQAAFGTTQPGSTPSSPVHVLAAHTHGSAAAAPAPPMRIDNTANPLLAMHGGSNGSLISQGAAAAAAAAAAGGGAGLAVPSLVAQSSDEQKSAVGGPPRMNRSVSVSVTGGSGATGGSSATGGSGAPAKYVTWRRPKPQYGRDYHKRHVDTLNPIAPCGACQEWLKKIAEVNPDFKVITFTDFTCDELFIKPIK